MSETTQTRYVSRLKEKYYKEVVPQLMQQFGYKSIMQVPRLVKVVINMGVGQGEQDPKQLDGAVRDLAAISGQKPVITRARKSISNFRIRQGHRIGAKVTLRGDRMYDFLDKLMNIVHPVDGFHRLFDLDFIGIRRHREGISPHPGAIGASLGNHRMQDDFMG